MTLRHVRAVGWSLLVVLGLTSILAVLAIALQPEPHPHNLLYRWAANVMLFGTCAGMLCLAAVLLAILWDWAWERSA